MPPRQRPQQHVQSTAEMTEMHARVEKQTSTSLPDVCNTNRRNAELTGDADTRVALPSQAGEAAKLAAEAGPWYFDPSESGGHTTAFSIILASWSCLLQGATGGDEDFSH